MKIGAHESVAGGLHLVFDRALGDGCEAVQIFARNQNRWTHRPYEPAELALWHAHRRDHEDLPLIVHDSYLINLCAPDPEKREKSLTAFVDEMERCGQLAIPNLVFHPGSHLGQGAAWGTTEVARSLDHCIETARDAAGVRLLIENTAGQGTNLGSEFQHLRDIIAASRYPERLGVCLDTCHLFAAGHDWTTEEGYGVVFDELAAAVGLDRVGAFHLNDSKRELGARVDRHARLGEGTIGLEPFRRLVTDERFAGVPAALETPPFEDGGMSFADGIAKLKRLREP